MFENIGNFFKKMIKTEQKELLVDTTSKDAAKERLHIVLMQDRANVSADFLELMKQEIIDVIKKYIVIDEEQIDVRLTNQENEDGTTGAPSLYANIPILNIRNDIKGEVLNQNSNLAPKDTNKENNLENVDFSDRTVIIPAIQEEESAEKEEKMEYSENTSSNDIDTEIVQEEKIDIKTEEETTNAENTENTENAEKQDELNVDPKEEKDDEKTIKDDIEDISKELEEIEDEEDDDDVTFDDLLKAAEEEEKREAEEKAKSETVKKTTSTKNKKSSGKGKKKGSKSSSKKRK